MTLLLFGHIQEIVQVCITDKISLTASNSQSNYFRYDASSTGYSPLIHSFSHLHIGLNQNVRIPVSLLLTPLKFTKFSIKNTYFDQWKKYALGRVDLDKELGEIKKHCMKLSGTQWNSIEENELYIR
ncbi:hypothetical protein QFZ20_001392 [Flavobacterium sp. W4I14]|nr:hypothetical protein [Flavobacterium sp. W4I14]